MKLEISVMAALQHSYSQPGCLAQSQSWSLEQLSQTNLRMTSSANSGHSPPPL